MQKLKRDLKENTIYLALWIIMFIAPLLGEYIQSSQGIGFGFNWNVVLDVWRVFATYFIIFLVHNFLVAPVLIYRQKSGRYLFLAGVLVALFVVVQCSFHPSGPQGKLPPEHQRPMMEQPFEHHPAPPHHQLPEPPAKLLNGDMLHTLVIILLLGMNLGVKLYFKNERDRKKMQLLKSRNLEQQLERLRYQLNPHFFMNTLNNIHALIDIDAAKAKTTIVDLSRLLRYVLYEGAKSTVPLSRDIAFMNDYLQLMKIRYADGYAFQQTSRPMFLRLRFRPCSSSRSSRMRSSTASATSTTRSSTSVSISRGSESSSPATTASMSRRAIRIKGE